MGLDMYLSGKKFFTSFGADRPMDDEGYEIQETTLRLGYWRKHANLHGYIVQTFGPKDDTGRAIDNCEDIELTLENLEHLLAVIKEPEKMPTTEGFFFGASDNSPEQITEDTEIITKAIGFLGAGTIKEGDAQRIWRSVIYRASW